MTLFTAPRVLLVSTLVLAAPAWATVECSTLLHDPSGEPTHVEIHIDSPAPGESIRRFDRHCTVPVTGVASAIGIPAQIDFYLVLDVSGSTDDSSGIGGMNIRDAEVAAARAFVDSIDLTFSSVALISFSTDAQLHAPLGSTRPELQAALSTIPLPGRGTNYTSALELVQDEWAARANPAREQVVLFLTDGEPRDGEPLPSDPPCPGMSEPECGALRWSERLHADGLTVNYFGLGLNAGGLALLVQLATAGGGQARQLLTPGDIVALLPGVAHVGLSTITVTGESGIPLPTTVTPDGHFTAEVPLEPGTNRIVVTARPVPPFIGSATCSVDVLATCVGWTCPAAIVLACDGNRSATVPPGWSATSDHSDVAITHDSAYAAAPGPDAAGTYPLGRTSVRWTLSLDDQEVGCSARVDVVDPEPPAFNPVWTSLQVDCRATLPADTPTARDACDPSPTVTLAERTEPGPCPQSFDVVRTWTARDVSGRSTSLQQRVEVRDVTPPELDSRPADSDVPCDAVPPAPSVGASDDCDPVPGVTASEIVEPGPCAGEHVRVRTWVATDACGNETRHEQRVRVHDADAPALAGVPADARAACAAPPAAIVTALDGCDGAPAVRLEESRIDGPCPFSFRLVRTWTATDDCGNQSTGAQSIDVFDELAPALSGVPADERAACTAVPPPPAVTASDECDPAPGVTFAETMIPGSCPGRYRIDRTWTATDACGNAESRTQRIEVFDDVPPVLAGVPADERVPCDAVPAPPIVTATDDCDPSPVVRLDERRTPGDCPGRHVLDRTWTATDACGNSSSLTQRVTVVDEEPPVVTASSDVVARIWPPRHDMVPVPRSAFAVVAHDDCSEPLTWRIVGCASDQPDNGLGDGNTTADCRITSDGVLVRAERQGGRPEGRRYVVSAIVIDACGNASSPAIIGTILVPHDQRGR